MNRKTEETVRPLVEGFVASQNGRFRDHCSDTMLTALIINELSRGWRRDPSICVVDAIVAGDGNAAYDAVRPLFEHVLEHACRASCNGHHVAQAFAAAMEALADTADSTPAAG